ncbi:DUF1275 domain-containing protein [Cellulomonas sp. zg-ZUI222]|uniref:DUF1275 domain-containing protein n=1 Tax=Cellulomonas wangleii TaxID=2816956 RepID=A0ABX8DC60_9CELL|nr:MULTISPECIES: YoaK family protein [Cellulomonas]MBO0900478.1 DUF1275 domain-containing protein [Cellulomonas sp. zg-ZUI22]MBO0922692.1 DUF1275 domain-containing protein [Cellulomonas wangleii]MBO0926443.1 DUF1275 domain-containing protein [Cellulomonas wangleii]QVI63887.1 DUF1275 domain-containing protein [Cellulomonas wangleii]
MPGDGAAAPRDAVSAALLLLTAASGALDAVTYLALDHAFAANMTGNVLFLGFALAGAGDVPLAGTVVALAAFVVGAVVGGRSVPRTSSPAVARATVATLAALTVAMVLVGGAWLAVPRLGQTTVLVTTGLLAGLSGVQAAAVKPLGNAAITTVVVTGTLVDLARDSRVAGAPSGPRHVRRDRALAVVALMAGAALGAVLVRELTAPLALGGSVLLRAAAVVVLARAARGERDAAPTAGPGRR